MRDDEHTCLVQASDPFAGNTSSGCPAMPKLTRTWGACRTGMTLMGHPCPVRAGLGPPRLPRFWWRKAGLTHGAAC
jgi:hypothetical protein